MTSPAEFTTSDPGNIDFLKSRATASGLARSKDPHHAAAYAVTGDGWAVPASITFTPCLRREVMLGADVRTYGNPTRAELRAYPGAAGADGHWATAGTVVTTLTFDAPDAYGARRAGPVEVRYPNDDVDDIQFAIVIFGTDLRQPSPGNITDDYATYGGAALAAQQDGGNPDDFPSYDDNTDLVNTGIRNYATVDTSTQSGSGTARFPVSGPDWALCAHLWIDNVVAGDRITGMIDGGINAPPGSTDVSFEIRGYPPAETAAALGGAWSTAGEGWSSAELEGVDYNTSEGNSYNTPDMQYWRIFNDPFFEVPAVQTGGRWLVALLARGSNGIARPKRNPTGYNWGPSISYTDELDYNILLTDPPLDDPQAAPVDTTDPSDPANDGSAGGQVFDYGYTATSLVPCQPAYRSVVASHAPTVLPRLGTAIGYRVAVTLRGGAVPLLDLPPAAISQVSWGRRINDVAEHEVVLTKRDPALAALAQIEAWVHELAIWRIPDQGQPQLVALGPFIDWTESRTEVTLLARDMGAWFGKRIIHNAFAFTDGCTDLAEIARHLILDGMGPDDPGLLPYAQFTATGISAQRSGDADKLMLDKELGDLAGLGLDYTFVGRRLIVSGDLAAQLPRVARLGGQHFVGDVEINGAGAEALTRVFKTNDQSDDSYIGYAGGIDPVLGLLENTDASDDITDNATARTAARVALAAAYPVPYYVRVPDGASLTPDAPITIDQLVPGVGMRVEITDFLKPLAGLQRLTQVKASWDAENGEQIQVSLSPWAAVPADDATVVPSAASLGVADADVESDPVEPTLEQAPLADEAAPVTDAVIASKTLTSTSTFADKSVVMQVNATLEANVTYAMETYFSIAGSYSGYPVQFTVAAMSGTVATFNSGITLFQQVVDSYQFGFQQHFGPITWVPNVTGTWTIYLSGAMFNGAYFPNETFDVGGDANTPALLKITRLAAGSPLIPAAEVLELDPGSSADDDADPDLNATATTDDASEVSQDDPELPASGGDTQTDTID